MQSTSFRPVLRALFGLALTAPLAQAQISGNVFDSVSLSPIEGAIVSVQATTQRAVTDAAGAFVLPDVVSGSFTIVAARKAYYNNSMILSGGSSGAILTLEPVATNDNEDYPFITPATCGNCHPDQLEQWLQSPMGNTAMNQWTYDIYDGTGTAGGMNGFVYQRDSEHALINPNSECASCHQPEAWVRRGFEGGLEDINDLSSNAMHGVSCDICHKVAHIDESQKNFPGIWPGVVTISRPEISDGPVTYGVLGDTDFGFFGVMRPSYQPQLTSAMCAACHQDKNDPDNDGDFEEANGVISEPTYLEWLASEYANPASPKAASCVDCHMPSYGSPTVCNIPGIPERDPETVRSHMIVGTTPEFLENAVEMSMRAGQANPNTLKVQVTVDNSLTGHHVPTGVSIRNVILLVEAVAYDGSNPDGKRLRQKNKQQVHPLGGIGNPKLGYYAGLPGKMYAKSFHDSSFAQAPFFTEATGIDLDTRIPAGGKDTTNYRFNIPPGTTKVVVTSRLIYRRSYRALIDEKGWTETGQGKVLEDLEPPYYGHLMEESERVVLIQ